MNPKLISELLDCALAAASAGASELAERFGGKLDIGSKSSAEDFVTDADLAAEARVRQVISELRPNDAITGEELSAFEGLNASVRWSIDPLDGTVNYTRGIPFFATSVGAVDLVTGEWLAGAVIAPMLGVTYFASKGMGSFKKRKSTELKLTGPDKNRSTKILSTGFSYQATDRSEQFQLLTQVMNSFVDVRRMGSAALDICMVADGTFDAYYEQHIKEHDWAAAMLIAEEAGLEVKRPEFVGDTAYVNMSH